VGCLKAAIAAVLPGASWQRCRVHFARNLLTRVPKASQGMVATLVRTIFEQPDHDSVWAQHARVVDQLTGRFADAATTLLDAALTVWSSSTAAKPPGSWKSSVPLRTTGQDLLAFSTFPPEHWSAIRSNNPQERLNKEIRRRTDVVGIFPNRAAVVRLVGAMLTEQNDEWAVAQRYMGPENLAKARLRPIEGRLAEVPKSPELQSEGAA
jgi:putative transposase